MAPDPVNGVPEPWRVALLESSLDCVIIMDASGRIVDINGGTERTFGVTREAVVGRLLGEVFVPPDLRARHHAGLARYMATGQSQILGTRIEVPALHASGRHIAVELAVVRLLGTEPPLFVGHLRTIEARLRSQRRLRVSAAVNAVLAAADDVDTAVRNMAAALGESLRWASVQLWAVTAARSGLDLRAWWDRAEPPIEMSEMRNTTTFSAGTGLPGIVFASGTPEWLEQIAVAPNFPRAAAAVRAGLHTAIGVPIEVRGRVVAVMEAFSTEAEARDEELLTLVAALGNQLGHFIEEMVARTALAQSESRYRDVLASIQDAFVVLDDSYRYLYANQRAGEWARRAPSEMIGRHLWEIYPSVRSTPLFDAIRRSKQARAPVTVEAFHVDLERWVEARLYPYPEGTAVFVTDISARKSVEAERDALLVREQEANRIKDEFLAVVSHELRTPLAPIIGWARMLKDESLPPEQVRAALESIERNALVESHLVEDLLDVSRIIAGKLTIAPVRTDTAGALMAATDTVRGPASAKNLRLTLEAAPDLPAVLADPKRLQQILSNVLGNAVKFTPEGGAITASARPSPECVEIVVSDSGPGIEAAFLPHVFDRFRQADARTTRVAGGLGLGLSIVRDLIAAHGGTIRVESEGTGKGTTVTLALPRA